MDLLQERLTINMFVDGQSLSDAYEIDSCGMRSDGNIFLTLYAISAGCSQGSERCLWFPRDVSSIFCTYWSASLCHRSHVLKERMSFRLRQGS